MVNDFLLLRHKITGREDYYPPHFRDYDVFEEVDPNEASCQTCVIDTSLIPQDELVEYEYVDDETDLDESEEVD